MISSRRNPRIADLARLYRARHRRQTGKTLLEGPHLLSEALAAGGDVSEVLALPEDEPTRRLCEERGVPLTLLSEEALSRIADTKNPRGPIAVLTIPRYEMGARDTLWLLVSQPGNGGTLIRTAAAFGWDVAMGTEAVDPWAPKVLRAGAGGHFKVGIGETEEAPDEALVIAAVPRGGVLLPELGGHLHHDRRWWLMIGDESEGVVPSYAAQIDLWCSIPMSSGTESLNAAVAGGIICQHLSRLRSE